MQRSSDLNHRERVQVSLELETPLDRPPVMAWGHDFVAEWSPEQLAESTLERARRFDWDVVKVQPRASCFAEAFGAGYGPSGSAAEGPRLSSWTIESAESWATLPEVDGSDPALSDQVETVAKVAADIGGERLVLQTVFSPFTVASYLAANGKAEARRPRLDLIAKDQARALRHLDERPDLMTEALVVITRTLINYIDRSANAGAGGFFYAIGGSASADALDQSRYEDLLLPHDLAVLGSVPIGMPVFVHLCGPRLNFDLARRLPAAAVSWATSEPGNPSLAEGRDRSGRAAVGGIAEHAVLAHGSPDDVTRSVRAAIDDTQGRGLIVGPGCTVPPATPIENLAVMVSSASF